MLGPPDAWGGCFSACRLLKASSLVRPQAALGHWLWRLTGSVTMPQPKDYLQILLRYWSDRTGRVLTRTGRRVLMSLDSGRWQVHLLVFGYLCCHVLACTPPLVMSDWNVGWERWSNHLKGFNSLPHHLSVASVGPPLYWLTHINRTYIIIFMRVMDHLRRLQTL